MIIAGLLAVALGVTEYVFRRQIANIITELYGMTIAGWDPGRKYTPRHMIVSAIGTTLIGLALIVCAFATGNLI